MLRQTPLGCVCTIKSDHLHSSVMEKYPNVKIEIQFMQENTKENLKYEIYMKYGRI